MADAPPSDLDDVTDARPDADESWAAEASSEGVSGLDGSDGSASCWLVSSAAVVDLPPET